MAFLFRDRENRLGDFLCIKPHHAPVCDMKLRWETIDEELDVFFVLKKRHELFTFMSFEQAAERRTNKASSG